jgi:hypothetical protein
MSLWIAYTPIDAEQKSNRTFGLLSVRRPKIPGLLDLAWPVLIWFTERIFAEDRDIVEMEQAAYNDQGADWNQEVFPAIRDLRELLAANGRIACNCEDRSFIPSTTTATTVGSQSLSYPSVTPTALRWMPPPTTRRCFSVDKMCVDRTCGTGCN